MQIKIPTEQRTMYIKDIAEVYIKRMKKDLEFKIFKHYLYIEYYIVVLEFVRFIGIEKTVSITFSKEFKIIKRHLIVKD